MNTESKINIHHSSLVELKAELLRKQTEVEAAKSKLDNAVPINKPKIKEKKSHERQNKKEMEELEKTNQTDDIESMKALQKSKLMLQAKSRLYEKLSKNHFNMNPNFLVDFEHKYDDHDNSEEEIQNEDNEQENYSDSDDEWAEYTDCFGRTRKCLREDLLKMQEKDELLKKNVLEKSPKVKEKVLYFEDRIPEKEPEIIMMRKKWEEETEKLAHKVDIHYQDVLFDEARTHGVGYFAFSKNEEERVKQQENLTKLRKETEQKQKENQEICEMKEKMQQNRLRVARLRQRIRAGLPAEDNLEETIECNFTDSTLKGEDNAKAVESNLEQNEKQAAAKRKLEDMENKIEAFGELLGKRNKWYVMSQEEWTQKKRKERIEEFAPVYDNFQSSGSLNFNCDNNKYKDSTKLSENECSNDSDIIGPLPPPSKCEPNNQKQIPLVTNKNHESFEDSTGDANIQIADQVEAGLKYLREQFENKNT